MPDVAFTFGKVTLKATCDLTVRFDGVDPPRIPLVENVVTYELAPWHIEQGIPKDGAA